MSAFHRTPSRTRRPASWFAAVFSLALLPAVAAHGAEGRKHVLREFYIHPDLTYDKIVTIDDEAADADRAGDHTNRYFDFSPASEKLEVSEAWVEDKTGTRHPVPASDIVTRSKPQDKSSPGFNADQRMSIVFPNVQAGAHVHVRWKLTRKALDPFGFHLLEGAFKSARVDDETIVLHLPDDLALQWHADGPVRVSDRHENGERVVTAVLQDVPKLRVAYPTVNFEDFRPRFMATTMVDFAQFGAIVRQAEERPVDAATRARIKALADTIVAGKTGLAAAAAIHDWIRAHIAYVAVWLKPNEGWIEHPLGVILDNGFGDCKDQTALMRALLAAEGIASERALVDWGDHRQLLPLPLPEQFNHVILYLPDFQQFDNPTDKNARFDALDRSLIGKKALLIETTGRLIDLPAATPDRLSMTHRSHLVLSSDGSLKGEATVDVSADLAPPYRARFDRQEAEGYLDTLLGMNDQEGSGKLEKQEPADGSAPLRLSGHWVSPDAVDLDEAEIYLPLQSGLDTDPLAKLAHLVRDDVRVAPFAFGPFLLDWTFEYDLPSGLSVRSLPAPLHVANAAGSFDSETTAEAGRIVVHRHLLTQNGVTQPADYPALKTLLMAAVKAGRSHAILEHQDR